MRLILSILDEISLNFFFPLLYSLHSYFYEAVCTLYIYYLALLISMASKDKGMHFTLVL